MSPLRTSWLIAALVAATTARAEDTYLFTQNSSPAGFVSSSEALPRGSAVATTNAPRFDSGYRFAYWTLNDVKQVDLQGRAANPVRFMLLEPTTATAFYRAAAEDANTNGVPDWFELHFFPGLTNAAYDPDGDGFGLAEEFQRDWHPAQADTVAPGGVAVACSPACIVILDTNLAAYSISTVPAGLIASSGITNRGTWLEVLPSFGATNGYRLAYWTLNGVVQTDLTGRAVSGFGFTLASNTTAQGVFLPVAQDADGDAVPDWFEQSVYGPTGQSTTSDTDADGFTLREEYCRDMHPLMADTLRPGGISIGLSGPAFVIPNTNFARYSLSTVPAGFAASSGITNRGTWLAVSNSFGATNGYRLAYWTLNGVVQTDLTGRAVPGFGFALAGDTTVQGVFLPVAQDIDGDAVPDWFEQSHYAPAGQAATGDTDGDGLTLLEEYRRDLNPLLADTIRAGGVSVALSAEALAIVDTNMALFTLTTEPAGLATASAITNRGAVLTVPNGFGPTNGYRFTYWLRNGNVETDLTGRALSGFAFSLDGDTAVHGVFLPQAQDEDADTVPDWYERNFYGPAGQSPTSDTDGDGFSLAEEFQRDSNPLLADRIGAGGISVACGAPAGVEFRYFNRVGECLVGGAMSPFFSLQPPGTGTFAMAGCSAPALGDWDGDGDLDLFVGGQYGQMRMLENRGSPVVLNFQDRTTNFTARSWVWAEIDQPTPALGDWNGDGAADLAVGGSTGTVTLLESSRGFLGPQAPALVAALEIGGSSAIPAFAELNGDGRLDLLVLLDDGTVNAYTNTGNEAAPFGTSPGIENLLGMPVADATGLTTDDVDEDGDIDVLISDTYGNIWEFAGDGTGHFTVKSKIYAGSFTGFASRLTIAAGDVDGDGDGDLFAGYAGGGLMFLRNPRAQLLVRPHLLTVMAGAGATFDVVDTTNAVTWRMALNGSGGTVDAVSGAYVSGTNAPATDLVEARDPATGLRGQAFVNVIGVAQVAQAGKAIVLAGRKGPDDNLWPTTDRLADQAYRTLLYRGFTKETVQYLSPAPEQDVDGNGAFDDIDLGNAFTNVAGTFTNWVGNADRLFVYLVDHGGVTGTNGYFRLSASENLTAAQLDVWLDGLQDEHTNMAVTVLLDFCNAGSFVPALSYTGTAERIVIASCAADQASYFVAGGLVSFSDAFFSSLLLGLDVGRGFELAAAAIGSYQDALFDDDKDGQYQPGIDGALAAERYVGGDALVGRSIPGIGAVCPDQVLSGSTRVQLWAANVDGAGGIARVWCLVIPPGHRPDLIDGVPVSDVPELELTFNPATGRYEADYEGFSQEGAYKILYYAKDYWESVSLPVQAYVTQDRFDERVVLVTCGDTDTADGQTLNGIGGMAYERLRKRWFDADQILHLSNAGYQDEDRDGTNDVDGVPTLAAVASAITAWAAPSDKLTVYLIGKGTNGALRLNETETLNAATLDGWLDAYQASNRPAQVVMDFDQSAAFLPQLIAPAGRQRVNIASAIGASARKNGGLVGFTHYFMTRIFVGDNLWDAFDGVRTILKRAAGNGQVPVLDDNGDGRGDGTDGVLARRSYIGTAFVTGADGPVIGRAMPDTVLDHTNSLWLWAEDVTDMHGVSNVFCIVTPPGGGGDQDLPEIDLAWNDEAGRYEAFHTGFDLPGSYYCSFFAVDANGDMSAPAQAEVFWGDAYEPDDAATQAVAIALGAVQERNFHAAGDEDWTMFCADGDETYEIRTRQTGTAADTALALYRALPDGSFSNLWERNAAGAGAGVGETVRLEANDHEGGLYLLRTWNAAATEGPDTRYDLSVTVPAAEHKVIVQAINRLILGPVPATVKAMLGGEEKAFAGKFSVSFDGLPDGDYGVTLTGLPAGWEYVGGPPQQTARVQDGAMGAAVFHVVPYFRVTGEVRDGWTGERLAGAALRLTGRTGLVQSQAATNWESEAEGNLPADVKLVCEDWDLEVTRSGYAAKALVLEGRLLYDAGATNLGRLNLTPVDANSNAIADAWETSYFGAGSNVVGSADEDEDGLDNRLEYLIGTHPRDDTSRLEFTAPEVEPTQGLILSWPVANGRTYRLSATENLTAEPWSLMAGPWTAAAAQTNMAWTNMNATLGIWQFYRIEVQPHEE